MFSISSAKDLTYGRALTKEVFSQIRVLGFKKNSLIAEFPDEIAKINNRYFFSFVFTHPTKGHRIVLDANAKIESVAPKDGEESSKLKLVYASLSQYDVNRWEEIKYFFQNKQEKVSKLFKQLKG